MDVLISWSKKQSKEMAAVFHAWLPKVVPGFRILDVEQGHR